MFIGVAIGAYSSIFIAAPVLTILKGRERRYRQIEARRSVREGGDRKAAVDGRSDRRRRRDGTARPTRPPPGPPPAREAASPGPRARSGRRPSGSGGRAWTSRRSRR